MTDRYEKIRKALKMGPTPGPWYWSGDSLTHRQFNIYAINGTDKHIATVNDLPVEKLWARDQVESEATAKLIAACDPDTIRELLAERDELLDALQLLFNAAYFGFATSIEFGRAEAAIAKANGGEQ